ncbi:MAG: type II secretion system F family protein [Cupriavidus sp.]|nr:type II secretion system F family protein [Cupriavidus sp.]
MWIAQIVLMVGTFVIVSGVTWAALSLLRQSAVQRRVAQINQENPVAADEDPSQAWLKTVEQITTPFARLSAPNEGWDASALRIRLMNAGWRAPEAVAIYFGSKTLLACCLPLLLAVALVGHVGEGRQILFINLLFIAAVAGFYFPNLVLRHKIRRRQRNIFEAFPDSLDLIMVCVEAGLSLDAAILRVVQEMRGAHREIAEEYEILTLELRAGLQREKALRNLAVRTGVSEVDMLVSMLIQADRFGTSVADSLRVHSDMLRVKRQMLAEERAVKISTKLMFPLILCIFPSLLVVLLGPPAIQVVAALRIATQH